MEHDSEDSIKLQSAIGGMDFEHSEDIHEAHITLDASGNEGDIPIEYEHVQDKSTAMLMDTGNEEIIVSDFMGDQFTLQEYSIRDDQTSEATTTEESNIQNILQTQSDTIIDMQFDPQTTIPVPIAQDTQTHPKHITVKVASSTPASTTKRSEQGVLNRAGYRQVAIAPKPPELVQTAVPRFRSTTGGYSPTKQYAIAPKPVALVANRTNFVKKLPQGGKHVLAQIGKQFIMLPSSAHQKLKLVSSSDSTVQCVTTEALTKLTSGKNIAELATKPMTAKVVMQGNQQAVITKVVPTPSTTSPRVRYLMQQKTVPTSIGNNKVVLTSPKQGKKQQFITIKSAPSTTSQQQVPSTTKKVLITANPTQKVILKTAPTPKTAQLTKDGKVILQHGQRSQLHKIDVPGKGVQLIRLITNPTSGPSKVAPKQTPAITVPGQSYVLTDKGSLIPMTAEKMVNGQPPPLVSTGHITAAAKPQLKLQQKLVRIAPATAAPTATVPKISQATQQPRSGQSLLTPQPALESSVSLEELSGMLQPRSLRLLKEETEDEVEEMGEPEHSEAVESKASLHALIAETLRTDDSIHGVNEVEVDFERQQSPIHDESTNSMDHHDSSARSDEHPLIVIPSSYPKQDDLPDEDSFQGEHQRMSNNMVSIDAEDLNSYQLPTTPPLFQSDSEAVSNELTMRPRKACNCTKSQCLKLYCDCFANGEFCNHCNCNNCHNNLENEELRQKAIRACLDRNPNAFRPKIGKSKTGGPEIIRRHNKGCNCKRSGCLKNYCECYEAKIACTSMCKCVGCRNVEETLGRARRRDALVPRAPPQGPELTALKQPCSFMTGEVIEAVCQCLVAAAAEPATRDLDPTGPDAVRDVIDEFARCLQDIISASHHTAPRLLDEAQA